MLSWIVDSCKKSAALKSIVVSYSNVQGIINNCSYFRALTPGSRINGECPNFKLHFHEDNDMGTTAFIRDTLMQYSSYYDYLPLVFLRNVEIYFSSLSLEQKKLLSGVRVILDNVPTYRWKTIFEKEKYSWIYSSHSFDNEVHEILFPEITDSDASGEVSKTILQGGKIVPLHVDSSLSVPVDGDPSNSTSTNNTTNSCPYFSRCNESSYRLVSLMPVIIQEAITTNLNSIVYLECEDDEFVLALLNALVQSPILLSKVVNQTLKFVCRFKLGYSFWVDQNFMSQLSIATIFDENSCFTSKNRLTSFIVLCLMCANKFGPSLSMLTESLIKIKAFEDIIDKWPEKVFINSSLNLDESDMLVEHYMLSGRNDSGNIQAILMFYAWLFIRANCELRKYIRQDYVATFFPRNDPKSGQEVVEEILKELFNPSNDYCILYEKIPPVIEGLYLASNRVLCSLENIASWSRDRIDVFHRNTSCI